MDQDISGDELHSILSEIDTNQNGQVELDEYLQVSIKRFFLNIFIIKTCNLFSQI